MTFVKPKIGDGATVHIGSDSYPYTVIEAASNSMASVVKIQADSAVPGPGHDYYNKQVWTFAPFANGEVKMFRFEHAKASLGWREIWLRKSTGRYVLRTPATYRLVIGERHKFSDPSF